ncbi:MAG: hypothetical protein ACD_67C00038G0002 [uncultured bacterium]|nr:MAG: hypothetical protein ACD_67C00038G0002 [uncultured bacterium]
MKIGKGKEKVMPDEIGTMKEARLLLVTNERSADEAIIRHLRKSRQRLVNIAFMDDKGNLRNGWVVEFQAIDSSLEELLYENRFNALPFIDDGMGLPRRWNLLGNRKKAAKNIMRIVQKRLEELTLKNKI